MQIPLLLAELAKLERSVEIAKATSLYCVDERVADLQIYLAQLKRILLNSLYLLEVKTEDQRFDKIAMTTQQIAERIAEVQRKLKAHYFDVVVNLLGLWQH